MGTKLRALYQRRKGRDLFDMWYVFSKGLVDIDKVVYICIGIGALQATYGMFQVFNPHLGVLWLQSLSAFKGMARGTIIYRN